MKKKRTILNKREAEVLFMVEDMVADPMKISAEGDIEIAEVNEILQKLKKLGFVKLKMKGKKIVEASATEKGILYMDSHRKKVPY